ncbi:MAG: Cu(I)-responsive transcriptional regulator [Ancalomicrobiaceae bacterium]|nr:Cu(I)-responsive transcriptional regulator [Ancalomicrobiaceae bacterium]
MNIGEAARLSGVSAKMIRHYEAIALLPAAQRRGNSYRDYGDQEIFELRFIRRGRKLGFSIPEIGDLLALWRDKSRPSSEVRRIAHAHLQDLEIRIEEMVSMAGTLRHLVDACHGDHRPACPILDNLGGMKTSASDGQ